MRPADGPGGPPLPPAQRQEPGLLGRPGGGSGPSADRAALRLLARGEVEVLGRLANSSNGTFLVRCRAGEAEALAVYKPVAGERPLWDFPPATLHRREAAAYELSRLLGWDLVPPTLVRPEAPLGEGSLQLFVEHDPERHYFNLRQQHARAFRRLALFDAVCNNADRKAGHCLLDGQGRIRAIDHGLTFNVDPKLRTVIWDFAGEPVPAADRRAVERLREGLAEGGAGHARLAPLLAEDELAALRRRCARWSRPGRLPAPDSSWSFPWPLL